MIRWRFVFTRLIIIAGVLVLLRWGLGPVAKYVTVRVMEQATGAKVEIDQSSIGFFPPRIHFADVNIADPRADKAMRDAFHADTIDLVIDGDALLQRRWVARDGRITGIEIDTARQTSGHYENVAAEDTSGDSSMISKLLGTAAGQIGDQAEQVVEDLETVRRSKQIRDRWESEYESLVVQAKNLEKLIRDIRDEARDIENPLRDLPVLARTLDQAKVARDELMSVRQKIDALPEKLQADLGSLDEAKRIDIAKVDAYVPGDLTQSDNFGVDLMAKAVRDQIEKLQGYLDSGRALADYTVVAPESVRVRGADHDLWGNSRRPGLLVRRCEISGLMRADGNAYVMTGVVENLTPDPELLDQPAKARVRLDGNEVVQVEFVKDRRGGADVDLLTVHWPQSDAKPIQLGDRDAGLSVTGGQRELWVQVRTEGKQIEGHLVSKQTGLKMNLDVDPRYAKTPAAVSLTQSLAAVNQIEIDARFDGTWKDMDLRLNTNLGQILHRAANDAIVGQTQATKAKMIANIEKAHLQQTLELREWLGKQQSETRSLLASADKSIAELSERVLQQVGQQDAYLGKLRSAIQGRLR
tara:strand:- start:69199 stop:70947 length:1749 start_codon:yes stop_codon:yes gene_type:complete